MSNTVGPHGEDDRVVLPPPIAHMNADHLPIHYARPTLWQDSHHNRIFLRSRSCNCSRICPGGGTDLLRRSVPFSYYGQSRPLSQPHRNRHSKEAFLRWKYAVPRSNEDRSSLARAFFVAQSICLDFNFRGRAVAIWWSSRPESRQINRTDTPRSTRY